MPDNEIIPLVDFNGEPRVQDLALAQALGMKRQTNIRALIERHAEQLARFGGICTTVVQNGRRGRPSTEYHLNEHQAVYIVTQSEAPAAKDATVEIVKVFVAWRHGRLEQKPDDAAMDKPFEQWSLRDLQVRASILNALDGKWSPSAIAWLSIHKLGLPAPPPGLMPIQGDMFNVPLN